MQVILELKNLWQKTSDIRYQEISPPVVPATSSLSYPANICYNLMRTWAGFFFLLSTHSQLLHIPRKIPSVPRRSTSLELEGSRTLWKKNPWFHSPDTSEVFLLGSHRLRSPVPMTGALKRIRTTRPEKRLCWDFGFLASQTRCQQKTEKSVKSNNKCWVALEKALWKEQKTSKLHFQPRLWRLESWELLSILGKFGQLSLWKQSTWANFLIFIRKMKGDTQSTCKVWFQLDFALKDWFWLA